jgi:hypothetical protein
VNNLTALNHRFDFDWCHFVTHELPQNVLQLTDYESPVALVGDPKCVTQAIIPEVCAQVHLAHVRIAQIYER